MVDGSHFRIVVQEEDVLGVGRPPAQIQRLGQAEVFRQADELHVREIVAKLRAAVAGSVIDDDHLQAGACLGSFDGFQALAATSPPGSATPRPPTRVAAASAVLSSLEGSTPLE